MKALLLLLLHFLLASLAHCSSGKKIRWCTLSDAEQRKCSDLSRALVAILTLTDTTAFGRVSCIRMRNTRDCVDKIRANKADAASLDAGDVYSCANLHGLTVAAKEVYAEGNCVFAVAVVRRGTPRNIHALKGSRSCHNGARWTSGWSIPLGFLLSSGDLVWDKDRPLRRAVADYFNASCVPGAGDLRLCALCRGVKSYLPDRNHFCETNGDEPFYDSEGAFRCLASGAADVAFLDHLAIVNASESDQESFALLCADGSTAPLTDYTTCNLGRGPGRAIVTRRSFRKIAVKFITVVQVILGGRNTFIWDSIQGTRWKSEFKLRPHPVEDKTVESVALRHVMVPRHVNAGVDAAQVDSLQSKMGCPATVRTQ
ncbi:saxiphilin-like [Sceloporus undulatus]|uniref:saxiphilin-like n=1 Tax=Sceloporus undulatus TaxID=8520 RepID=UPI001C4C9BE2|nr:saxiphilin-like [Sceloporus undulatus]